MAGAFNQFATGIGNTDAGFIIGTGKLLIKVPETMRFLLEGSTAHGRDGEGRDPARASATSGSTARRIARCSSKGRA